MPVTLKDLVLVRSQIALEVIEYLEALAAKLAELPAYCPEHLRSPGPGRDGRGGGEVGSAGRTAFDHVRQRIEIAEDRWAFEQWVVEDRERTRRAGEGPQRSQYRPTRSRPDIEDPNEARRKYRSVPITVTWDEHAAERFRRAVVLGDPGFGKTWLLNFEGRRVALGSAKAIRDQTSSLAALEVPIHARLSELNGALARLLRS